MSTAEATITAGSPTPKAVPHWPLGIVALVVGTSTWILGAKFTLSGLINGANLLAKLIGIPLVIPQPVGWYWLLAVIPGVIYSLVEIWFRPGPISGWAALPTWAISVFLLILVHASDVGSTFAGYLYPAPDAWTIHQWLVDHGQWLLFVLSVVLTYMPEQMIKLGLKWTGIGKWNRSR